jgi:hypothetical protein
MNAQSGVAPLYPSIVLAPAVRRALPYGLVLMLIAGAWFALVALATPFDHDESQYIAGAYLSGRMMIFRDFLYLQPPLHAWAFAPLAWVFPDNMVLAMRLATAATALATLGALWTAQRSAGISRESALIATTLIAVTAAFQFTAAVVRNDMLPTLLSALAIAACLRAVRNRALHEWAVAGALFGLSIATKLSFAPVGLAAGLFVLAQPCRCGVRAATALALGALAGMAPALFCWLMAPNEFYFGLVTFAMTGPFAWYSANGATGELTIVEKLADLVKFLAYGPALAALLLIALDRHLPGGRPRTAGRKFGLWLLAGGLLGAAMPTPTHVQYLMPLLPPLALALGYVLDNARHRQRWQREVAIAILCLSAFPGLIKATGHVVAMASNGSPVLEAKEVAEQAREVVTRLSNDDEIVTLSPQMVVDSGLELDPRVAAGPFVYRTGWTMTAAMARDLNTLTPATLGDLDRDPPDAILVGYEDGMRKPPTTA